MTREEALKVASEMHGWLKTDREKEALETLIPELKESEDERIIRTLQEYVKTRNWNLGGPTQDEVLAWLEREKKKTVEIDEIIRKARSEGRQEVIDNPEYYQLIKPEETQEPECDNETETQKAYREGKNAGRKEVFDHPEYYGLQPRRMYDYETGERNPEWSEEDEKTINELCDIIASNAKNGYLGGYYAPDLVKKLKSLHNQPKQEWSKEDENKVERLAFLVSVAAEKEMISEEECIDLRRFVKSYHPQPKKEWSEEDEKMLYQVLCYLDPTITRAKREEIELWLKSLLERFNLQPKQERNEEDEKVRKWLLEYFYLHRDDLRGASVTSMEVLSFLDKHPGKVDEDIEEFEFNPKPGEKFWVRCKTHKTENLWFDKDDERPAYAVTDPSGIITYIVHIKKDGTGNCVSYQDKEKFLKTFDILDSKR